MLRKSFIKTTFLLGQLHSHGAYYLAELLTPATTTALTVSFANDCSVPDQLSKCGAPLCPECWYQFFNKLAPGSYWHRDLCLDYKLLVSSTYGLEQPNWGRRVEARIPRLFYQESLGPNISVKSSQSNCYDTCRYRHAARERGVITGQVRQTPLAGE